jgi:hypothetical protein
VWKGQKGIPFLCISSYRCVTILLWFNYIPYIQYSSCLHNFWNWKIYKILHLIAEHEPIISQFVTDQKKSIVKRSSSSDNGNVKCSEATIGIFNLNFELSFNKKAISRFNIIVFPIFYRSYYSYIIFWFFKWKKITNIPSDTLLTHYLKTSPSNTEFETGLIANRLRVLKN